MEITKGTMAASKSLQVKCSAGEWTRVIFDFGKGYPETRQIVLSAPNSDRVDAEYRETHYNWIFPKQPVIGEFSGSATFHRRWIDGIYSVYVKPTADCIASIQ
ncbi:MAG: hypothetical protein KTR18_05050 [Acidiferrobacterales bacterium]|nr:hypothetical protein [Acidiferrobacterales bacterium]